MVKLWKLSKCLLVSGLLFSSCFYGNCSKENPKILKMPDIQLPVTISGHLSTNETVSDNIIDADIEWKLTSDEPLKKNYKVALHFMDQDGEVLFVDDHLPSVPSSQWKKDEVIKYSRPIYIPFAVDQKTASVVIGLYDEKNPQEKIGLNGLQNVYKPARYVLGTLKILPCDDFTLDTERMDFKKGWYNLERDVRNRLQWRWTKEEAVCSIRNPKKQAVLYIRGWVPEFESPATVSIVLNGQSLEQFTAKDEFIKKYEINKELLGTSEWIDLVLKTDKLYSPSEHGQTSDPRNLGIMVKRIFFR
ncbi:MAG: hypothetical protein A2161_17550 [Candidatus Schekmanbacteria bacterium RBG_13_48_7]|uniref:Phosphodiester glycosidase domain-containing protein n=1 Tax=Candidatus Schekmanbacteria bacterium RBG_13_48_7 TaxID=1817878 RepID=A0A1F7S1S1_9BACT|nr:MAG: hypothetical protein A2161_17550 [Candidatus Schekmanbacteria bacterium RBG_13_48_7]